MAQGSDKHAAKPRIGDLPPIVSQVVSGVFGRSQPKANFVSEANKFTRIVDIDPLGDRYIRRWDEEWKLSAQLPTISATSTTSPTTIKSSNVCF